MVSINYAFKEIFSKIVYYGPGLSGKTTNLQYVFKKVPKDTRGELISLATDADRTLYFDFLPVNVGQIKGFDVKFQLYTVPGQVYYNATRKLVLRGVDGLVFVADSQIDKMDDNIESFKNLEENLVEYGYILKDMPFVIQYNKRDLPRIATIEQLQELLNPTGVPYFEAVAVTGEGVFGTLKAISKLVINKAKAGSERQTKPKPVVVNTSSAPSSEPKQQTVESAVSPTLQAPVQKPEVETPEQTMPAQAEPVFSSVESAKLSPEITTEPAAAISSKPAEKPTIMTESENIVNVNVVVSTTDEDTKEPIQEPTQDNLEETTEHSVLAEDTNEPVDSVSTIKHHPDVLDAEKLKDIYTPNTPESESFNEQNYDEEATTIADPHQTGHLMAKPQMAESKKVKDKKKIGLFGWLKKKKKDSRSQL